MNPRLGCEVSIYLHFIGVQLTRFLDMMYAYLRADEVLRLSQVKLPPSEEMRQPSAWHDRCEGFGDPVLRALWAMQIGSS